MGPTRDPHCGYLQPPGLTHLACTLLINHIPAGAFLYFQHHASPSQSPCLQVQGQEGSQAGSQHHHQQRQWCVVTGTLSQPSTWSGLFPTPGSPSPGRQPPAGAPKPNATVSADAHPLGQADTRYDPLALSISSCSPYGSSSHRHPHPTSAPVLDSPSTSQLPFLHPPGYYVHTSPYLPVPTNLSQDCQ